MGNGELLLVTLTDNQIEKAKEANGIRKRITHALLCLPYGQIFGTEKQCRKYFDAWNPNRTNPIFPQLFRRAAVVHDYFIKDFESTFNLVMILIEAQDELVDNPILKKVNRDMKMSTVTETTTVFARRGTNK